VYAAELNNVHYTFEASGSLWQDALVLRDRQTGSLWSQISGTCISGPLEGATLEQYPVHHTTFAEFKKQYPAGQILEKVKKGKYGSSYDPYFEDKSKLGIFGRINNFTRLKAKDKIFGLRLENSEIAISKEFLARSRYKIIESANSRILIYYIADRETVKAYYLPAIENEINPEFEISDNSISMDHNDLEWSLSRGEIIKGDGPGLRPAPVTTAFWFAWVSFFPQTKLIK